jgi:hypothetical protein
VPDATLRQNDVSLLMAFCRLPAACMPELHISTLLPAACIPVLHISTLLPAACMPVLHISTLPHKRHDFRCKTVGNKMCDVISRTYLSETFLTVRRIQRYIMLNVQYIGVHVQ